MAQQNEPQTKMKTVMNELSMSPALCVVVNVKMPRGCLLQSSHGPTLRLA